MYVTVTSKININIININIINMNSLCALPSVKCLTLVKTMRAQMTYVSSSIETVLNKNIRSNEKKIKKGTICKLKHTSK